MLLFGFLFQTAFNTHSSVLHSCALWSFLLEAKWYSLGDLKCLHLEEMWGKTSWGDPGSFSQLSFSCSSPNFKFSTFSFWQVENIRIGRLPREIKHQLETSPEYLNLAAYLSLFSDNLEWEMRVPTLSAEWRAEEVVE